MDFNKKFSQLKNDALFRDSISAFVKVLNFNKEKISELLVANSLESVSDKIGEIKKLLTLKAQTKTKEISEIDNDFILTFAKKTSQLAKSLFDIELTNI